MTGLVDRKPLVKGIGRLSEPPVGADWEFPPEEYRRRLTAIRQAMAAAGLDCLLLGSERNIRYVTGFHTQIWVSPTRPRFVLIPAEGEPVAVVPRSNVEGFRTRSWVGEIRWWPAPCPADEGVSLLAETIRALLGHGAGRGRDRPRDPPRDAGRGFPGPTGAAAGTAFVDGGAVLQLVRMVKSPEEVARLRRIAGIASEAFARLGEWLRPGQDKRNIHRRLHGLLVELGAETVPYLVPVSGPYGYDQINMGPTERRLAVGDVLVVDVGATFGGYFCDFDRNFAIGPVSDEIGTAYRRVFEATEAGLAAVRPGSAAADVYRAMAAVLEPERGSGTPIGRMGHGLGLDLTEPPSTAPGDQTALEPGMVITLEPSALLPGSGAMTQRLMVHEQDLVHEEDLVVTDTGYELLSRRALSTLPVV